MQRYINKKLFISFQIGYSAITIVLSPGTLHNSLWTKYSSRKVKKNLNDTSEPSIIMLNIVYSSDEWSKTFKNKCNISSLKQNRGNFMTVVLGSQTYIYDRYSFFEILSEAFKNLVLGSTCNCVRWSKMKSMILTGNWIGFSFIILGPRLTKSVSMHVLKFIICCAIDQYLFFTLRFGSSGCSVWTSDI